MVYQIYSEFKKSLVENISNSEKIRFPAILLLGPSSVGKRITAYHIIKKILNQQSCMDIFYQQNFCYLAKNFPFDEFSFLLSQITESENILVDKKIAIEKLKFVLLRFLAPFIYRISEIDEKSIDSKFLENASYLFYKLKSINFNNSTNLNEKEDLSLLISLCENIIKNKKVFKSDRIYLSEIKNIQQWIENSYQFDKRVVLIDNIELMQEESSNAFLKTLEEPDENLIFILTSSSKSTLLPTILSRCAIFEIDRIKGDELKLILESEWKINFGLLSNQSINSFYDLFTLLKSDINNFIRSVRETFELFFLSANKYHLFIENIYLQKDLNFFLRQLILFCESILNSYEQQNTIIASDISYEKIIRISLYLNKIEDFSKNYNYPIENALIFAYLNRKQILNGDFSGEKIIF